MRGEKRQWGFNLQTCTPKNIEAHFLYVLIQIPAHRPNKQLPKANGGQESRGSCKTQFAASDAFTDKKRSEWTEGWAMVVAIPWEVFVTFQVFFWVPSSNPSLSLVYFLGWVRSGALCSTFSRKQEFWAAGILLFCSLSISPLNVRNHISRNSLNSTIGMGKRNFLLKQHMM